MPPSVPQAFRVSLAAAVWWRQRLYSVWLLMSLSHAGVDVVGGVLKFCVGVGFRNMVRDRLAQTGQHQHPNICAAGLSIHALVAACVLQRSMCRGAFSFNEDTFEAGKKVVAASVTAANLTAERSVVPELTAAVVHTPALTLTTSESNCTLFFKGKRANDCRSCIPEYVLLVPQIGLKQTIIVKLHAVSSLVQFTGRLLCDKNYVRIVCLCSWTPGVHTDGN